MIHKFKKWNVCILQKVSVPNVEAVSDDMAIEFVKESIREVLGSDVSFADSIFEVLPAKEKKKNEQSRKRNHKN